MNPAATIHAKADVATCEGNDCQDDESTMAAPVCSMMVRSAERQGAWKSEMALKGWRTPSTSRKTTFRLVMGH